VTSSDSEAGTRFHYQLWIPICIFAGGLVVIPIGYLVRNAWDRIGWGLMILGPLAALGLAPTYFIERTVVDDKGFDAKYGFYGIYSQRVEFESVKSIRIVEEEMGGRRKRVSDVIYFDLKSGGSERLILGNELNREAGKQILKKAADRKIPIAEKT
jgi:hypothetical protein